MPVITHHVESSVYDLHVSIEDLRGNSLGTSTAQFEISKTTPEVSVIVNTQIDQQQLAAYILHYAVKRGDQQVEGKKSLFYAVPQLDTHLLMQRRFYAASQAAVRVVVTDPASQHPVYNAEVSITLDSNEVCQGKTNERGTLDAFFTLPAGMTGEHQIQVSVKKDEAIDQIQQPIQIQDVYKILLTTDKPLYQPGQVIHIRSLALRKPDLLPAGNEEMILEVEDSKGNKVFKRTHLTNEFGISAAEFQLAHELNEGLYKIRAVFGENTQEKTVTVDATFCRNSIWCLTQIPVIISQVRL